MKRTSLFDNVERANAGPPKHSEPRFQSLNRSGRADVARIRNVLEQWFDRLPEQAKKDLRSRFRSSDNWQHRSAFFELYLHELLRKLDFMLEPHPRLPSGKPKRPDYRVKNSGKNLFYLEATCGELSKKEAAALARINAVYDALDQIKSPNFYLSSDSRGYPARSPPTREIRESIKGWLGGLDPDEVIWSDKDDSLYAFPKNHFHHCGWDLTIMAVPRKLLGGDNFKVRLLPMRSQGLGRFRPQVSIRKAIESKATRYGELDLPFIVAINIVNHSCSEAAVENALLGGWWHRQGPKNTRVSAALVALNLHPFSIGRVTPVLWHNPWASAPLTPDIWPMSQMVPNRETGKMEKREGVTAHEVLGLEPTWPE